MYGRVAFGVAIEPPRSPYAPSMAPTIRLGKILGIDVGLALGLMFATAASPLVSDVFAWLAYVNVALALFNLVPAFPLDGGRLLSSLFWWRQGTRQRGVHSAVRIGRVLAYVMIGLGIVVTFTISPVNGIWLAFIGWFLLSAGSQEEAGTVMK